MVMSKQQRILVIKHGALGDIVQGLDAFASLRAGHPNAHISILTGPAFAKFVGLMPWFDEVLVDPRSSAINLTAWLKIRSILHRDWDAIVDFQCSGRTARYHKFLSQKAVRWFGTASGASDPYPDFNGVNNHRRMLVAAQMAGGADITADEADMNWLQQPSKIDGSLQMDGSLQIDGPAVLIPGCSAAKPEKKWPPERYAELADMMRNAGHQVVIIGTNTDRVTADDVLRGAPFCTDMVGKTDLVTLARTLQSAAMVVGNDTGPTFMAARLGAPTVMVMGPQTNPEMSAPTGRRCDWVRADAIDTINADTVMAAVTALR